MYVHHSIAAEIGRQRQAELAVAYRRPVPRPWPVSALRIRRAGRARSLAAAAPAPLVGSRHQMGW